jgi:hypothetical protein
MAHPSTVPQDEKRSFFDRMLVAVATILWLLMFFTSLNFLNDHLMTFVGMVLFVDGKDLYDYLLQGVNLAGIFLYGELIFGVFLPPGRRSFLPPVEHRINPLFSLNTALRCVTAAAVLIVLKQTLYLSFGFGWGIPMGWYLLCWLLTINWIFWRLYHYFKDRTTIELYEVDLPPLQKESKEKAVLQRLRTKLSTLEREQLIDLLYKREMLGRVTVQNVMFTVWVALALIFIGELVEELYSRM